MRTINYYEICYKLRHLIKNVYKLKNIECNISDKIISINKGKDLYKEYDLGVLDPEYADYHGIRIEDDMPLIIMDQIIYDLPKNYFTSLNFIIRKFCLYV